MWPFPCAEHVVHGDSYQLYKSIQESFPLHKNLLCCLWNAILTELRLQGRSQPCSYTDRPWYRAVAIVADRRSIAAACKNVSRNFFHQVCTLIFYRNACLVVLIHQNASCCSCSSILAAIQLIDLVGGTIYGLLHAAYVAVFYCIYCKIWQSWCIWAHILSCYSRDKYKSYIGPWKIRSSIATCLPKQCVWLTKFNDRSKSSFGWYINRTVQYNSYVVNRKFLLIMDTIEVGCTCICTYASSTVCQYFGAKTQSALIHTHRNFFHQVCTLLIYRNACLVRQNYDRIDTSQEMQELKYWV